MESASDGAVGSELPSKEIFKLVTGAWTPNSNTRLDLDKDTIYPATSGQT